MFSKLSRAITLAAREKGGNPELNFSLRLAIEKAKRANMPAANIEKAIKKGTGELKGEEISEVIYEIYGPGGIAILLQAFTDNNRRTVSEIKNILSKFGGRLGENNSVRYLFEEKGIIKIKNSKEGNEKIMMAAIEAGAEDIKEEEENIIIITKKEDLQKVKNELEKNYELSTADIEMVPKNKIEIDDKKNINKLQNLLEELEKQEDTNNIYTNLKQ